MSFFEKMVVRSGHPRRIIVGVITMIWMFYFLWFHVWIWATVALIVGVTLGMLATVGMHEEELAKTTLGKILLLHLHPFNVVLQAAGFSGLLYSFWAHSGVCMLMAISTILLGHMWGWHKVNEAL